MPTVQELLADPEFRALPAANRERVLTDAIAAEFDKGQQVQGPSETNAPAPSTTPGYQGLEAFHPGGEIGPAVPRTPGEFARNVVEGRMSPGDALKGSVLRDAGATFAPEAPIQKENNQGMFTQGGSLLGLGLGSTVGMPQLGEALGSTAGYAADVLTGNEEFSWPGAAMSVLPSWLLGSLGIKQELTRKAGQYAAKTGPGKNAMFNELSGNVERYNAERETAEALRRRTATEVEQAKVEGRSTVIENTQQSNAAQQSGEAVAKTAFEQGEQRKVTAQNQLISNVEQSNAATTTAKGAADEYVESANANLLAQFNAAKAADEARQAAQQRVFDQQMTSHKELLELQKQEKQKAADQLRDATKFIQQGDAVRAKQLLEDIGQTVPTSDQVKAHYADVRMLAQQNQVPITMPKLAAERGLLVEEADRLEGQLGKTPLTRRMRAIGEAGQGEQDLLEVWEFRKQLRAVMSDLQGVDTSYAKGQRRLYGRVLSAVDADMEALAGQHTGIQTWTDTVGRANAANLKHETFGELQTFVNSNLFDLNPLNGEQSFNPAKFLLAIEKPPNAQLKNYMQKTIVDAETGQTLYDLTKTNFTEYLREAQQKTADLRLTRRTGGMTIPKEPTAPATQPTLPGTMPQEWKMAEIPAGQTLATPAPYTAQPYQSQTQPLQVPGPYTAQPYHEAPTLNLQTPQREGRDLSSSAFPLTMNQGVRYGIPAAAATATYLSKNPNERSPYPAAAVGAGTAALTVGMPNYIAALLMRPEGQKFLLGLMRAQGPVVRPTTIGFLAAGAKAHLSGLAEPQPDTPR